MKKQLFALALAVVTMMPGYAKLESVIPKRMEGLVPVQAGDNMTFTTIPVLPVVDTNAVIRQVQKIVYLNPSTGNDKNNGKSRAKAVKTFQRAMDLCSYGTKGVNGGHYYNQIRIAGGTHKLSGDNFCMQTWHIKGEEGSEINGQYRKRNRDNSMVYKNISIYGESYPSACVLDGTDLKGLTSVWGVISLAGSNISIENITIQNSLSSRGISIGTGKPYTNSREERLHDILIRNVHINKVGTFGINLDEVDRAVVRSSIVTNSCMMNEGGKKYAGYPSALKCRYSTHVSFIDNKVYNNWGEGLNFNKSSYCYGSSNVAYDNYAINFYCDNAAYTIVTNNKLYNSPNDRRFWKRTDTTGAIKKAATNISIANEKYEYPLDSDNIFVFNNICLRGPIAFGYCDRTGGSNSFSNIYISNNTCIDVAADPGVQMSLINFIRSGIPATYKNINITNNIFAVPPHKLSSIVELAVTSERDAVLSQAGIVTANNYWSANPYKRGVHNFISQHDNKVNASLPVTISNMETLNDIDPAHNSAMVLARAHERFIAKDFFGNNRKNSPNSNVGAIENSN